MRIVTLHSQTVKIPALLFLHQVFLHQVFLTIHYGIVLMNLN